MHNESISRRTALISALSAGFTGPNLLILGAGAGLATVTPKANAIGVAGVVFGAWLYDLFNPHGVTHAIVDYFASANTRAKDPDDKSFQAMFDDDVNFNFDSGRNFQLKNGKVINAAATTYVGDIYTRSEVRRRGEFNSMELETMALRETRNEYGSLYPVSLRVPLDGDRAALVNRYREAVRADPDLRRRPMPAPVYARRVVSMDTGKAYAMVVGQRESDNAKVISFIA